MKHLNEEETKLIMECIPDLSCTIHMLDGVVKKEIVEKLKNVMNSIVKATERIGDLEDAEWEIEEELLEKISEKEGFGSIWSTGIKAEKMSDEFPEKINKLHYRGMVEPVKKGNKKNVTYLDLWKAADKLIRMRETDHIFIEDFKNNNNGNFELITGS